MSRLLTALHQERGLRPFEAYYFNNCIYEELGRNARLLRREAIPTGDLLRKLDSRWKVMIVGDAAMHPAELMEPNGNIDPRRGSPTRGIDWLHRIRDHFERVVWLNPEPPEEWKRFHTVRLIERIFPMFHLSVDGISTAVGALIGGGDLRGRDGSLHGHRPCPQHDAEGRSAAEELSYEYIRKFAENSGGETELLYAGSSWAST